MVDSENNITSEPEKTTTYSCLQVLGIMVLTTIITTGVTLWVAKTYLFPSQFEPVTLTAQEEKTLSAKLDIFSFTEDTKSPENAPSREPSVQKPVTSENEELNSPLPPETYSEKGAHREISFTEREVNAMLATNTDLASKMAIDLSDGLLSARLRLPISQDFPMFGGKTLRAATGLELAYRNEKPVVTLKGVKIMGVPIPNAWMGGLKNIDLVREFGSDEGFWKLFADGVESIEVKEGKLNILLNE